ALKMETAGVIRQSPNHNVPPMSPPIISHFFHLFPLLLPDDKRAIRAISPPSPSLSSRSMKIKYLKDIRRMSVQKISDNTPKTFSVVTPNPCDLLKAS